MRIDITSPSARATLPEVLIDGHRRQDPKRLLLYQDASAAGIWLNGERQYGAEVYVDEHLQLSVGDRSKAVDAQYEVLEAAGHGPEPGELPSEVDIAQQWLRILPGRMALAKLKRLARSERIFRGNVKALLEHLSRMHDPAQLLPTWSNQAASEEFAYETERHLHNAVAAAASRVVYYRNSIDDLWPKDSPLREEYERRLDEEFRKSSLHGFIIDLRNFILHWRLPVSTQNLSYSAGGPIIYRTLLNSADLLRWPKWNSLARKYIQASGDSIDLAETVRTYTDQAIAFYQWVAESFALEHATEIETYQHAEVEYMALLRRLGLTNDTEAPEN